MFLRPHPAPPSFCLLIPPRLSGTPLVVSIGLGFEALVLVEPLHTKPPIAAHHQVPSITPPPIAPNQAELEAEPILRRSGRCLSPAGRRSLARGCRSSARTGASTSSAAGRCAARRCPGPCCWAWRGPRGRMHFFLLARWEWGESGLLTWVEAEAHHCELAVKRWFACLPACLLAPILGTIHLKP